jgi:hypothetical protein
VLKETKESSEDYFKAITLWQSNFDILSLSSIFKAPSDLIALFILSSKIIMKVSSVISFSVIFASALAFPTYGNINGRQTWQPRNWTAPGPNDGKSNHLIVYLWS